ncbi:hypothetical protein [Pedococcus sp. 2YAF34]|uniref:hypothetical protein n=1 Tax=Pedococcus sp. 2YAF34 TaxID=3233032 RepID=UPI003F991754
MGRLSERMGTVGLAVLLVVDVVLVGTALTTTHEPVTGGGAPVVATPVGTGDGAAAPGASATISSSSAAEAVPLVVGLTVVNPTTAVRFTTGTCADGGATMALTTDGGRSWKAQTAPFDVLTRVRVRANGSAFAVGADSGARCAARIRQADSYSGSFGTPRAVQDAWFRDPHSAGSIGLPTGHLGRPCGGEAVVDLSVVDAGAVVLCSDGRVLSSASGDHWKTRATLDGALAVAQTNGGRVLVAAPGLGGCAGVAVVDAASPDTVLGCAALDTAKVEPGTVALAVTTDGGWLAVGDDTYRSDKAYSTWKS